MFVFGVLINFLNWLNGILVVMFYKVVCIYVWLEISILKCVNFGLGY